MSIGIKSASQDTSKSKQRGQSRNFFKRLIREKPLGTVGLLIVLLLFLTGIFANFLAPEKNTANSPGYNIVHVLDRLKPPSSQHPLGTDQLGRDVLSRVIYGARLSMIVAVVATLIHTVVSTVIGMACAYFGGWFDLIVQRFVDAWICFPPLVILITLMSVIGPGLIQILLVLGVSGGIHAVRMKRSLVFAIKENQYVYASRAMGASHWRTMIWHLFPNILPMIIVIFSTAMGGMIMAEASLSFLGFGLPAPYPSWGGMISGEGRSYLLIAPWMVVWPGLTLSLTIFGINMFGDAARDLLDPRLSGGLGSYKLEKTEVMRRKILDKAAKNTGRE